MAIRQEEMYCSIDKFRTQHTSINALSAVHMNTRSIRNKVGDIGVLLQETSLKFDLMLFIETWLLDCEQPPLFHGYASYSLRRHGRKGGGVAIYVKECVKHSPIDEFSIIEDDVECLSLKISNVTVSVIYRPPCIG